MSKSTRERWNQYQKQRAQSGNSEPTGESVTTLDNTNSLTPDCPHGTGETITRGVIALVRNRTPQDSSTRTPAPRRSTEIRYERVLVTPEFARKALARNRINRGIHRPTVKKYAWIMLNDLWELTEDAIAFDPEGWLVQGQHRLEGVIEANTAVWMMVAYNAPGIWATRDRGRTRAAGDFLQWSDGSHANQRNLSATIAHLELLTKRVGSTPSTERQKEILRAHEPGLAWAYATLPARTFPAVLAAFAYAYPVASAAVAHFAKQFVTGIHLSPNAPALTLRKSLPATAPRGSARLPIMLRVLGALRAHMQGRKLSRVEGVESIYEWYQAARVNRRIAP